MPLTIEQLVTPIKAKGMEAVDEVAALIAAHENCVDLLVAIESKAILGLDSYGEFLFALSEKLLPIDEIDVVTLTHITVLALLEKASKRSHKNSKIRLVSLYRNIFGEKQDGSYHDQCIGELRSYTNRAVSYDPSLKILIVGWLYGNEWWQEASDLAQTMSHEDVGYHDALYFIGLYNILQDEASFSTFFVGLNALLNIPEGHNKHWKKTSEVKDAIIMARDNIRQEGQHGFVVTHRLDIFRGAKNPIKHCEVPDLDEADTGLTLHERQALVERMVDLKGDPDKVKLVETKYGDKYNHLIVNMGFIVTDRVWQKGGGHRRRFCTMPLLINNATCWPNPVLRNPAKANATHTEPFLFSYLRDENNLIRLLRLFKAKFSIKGAGHKVYGMVIDCHSTFDMCGDCFTDTKAFFTDTEELSTSFRPLLLSVLKKEGFVLPKERVKGLFQFFSTDNSLVQAKHTSDDRHFSITIRFSSNCDYPGPRRGKTVVEEKVDLRSSDRHLLLHGSDFWHKRWTHDDAKDRPQATRPEIPVENWTVLSTKGAPAAKAKAFNFDYSHLGLLDLRRYELWKEPMGEAVGTAAVEDQIGAMSLNAAT